MENRETNAKILVVDDSAFDLQLVDWILQEKNYETIAANNGTEALKLLGTLNPDLILLDIMLPDISGFEVCKKIKLIENLKDVPVIFFTSLSNVEDIVKGFEAGGVDYVTKPFNKDELLVRIQNHLELIRSKRQIELQAQELRHANALKDKMFSVISHDLRSPLSSIKLTLDFVATGVLKPDSELFKDTVKDLVKTTDEAYVLLENLLGWAKSQSNTLKVHPENLELKSLALSVVGLLKLSSENKKIKIENKITDDIIVLADMQMVHSVFRNLLSNALKFTPGNGAIEINTLKKDIEVEISIKDSGVGISTNNLKKIFDQNQSVKTFGTNNEAGSGLGLVLCKDFVEKNGGKIWVESESGKGSIFTFTLPLA
ncbi:MAG TPA: hybrid sensor histidine kinase/response regulator [Draconibacterium sp.]|nr:hybrid sensor histidine kinase/response regulator [Draconibacterium sp.]